MELQYRYGTRTPAGRGRSMAGISSYKIPSRYFEICASNPDVNVGFVWSVFSGYISVHFTVEKRFCAELQAFCRKLRSPWNELQEILGSERILDPGIEISRYLI